MKRTPIATSDASRYVSAGPFVWAATVVFTMLLLAALNHVLWLVVPLLFAIILYFGLFPVVRRLTMAGLSRESAAAIVAGGFFLITVAAMVPTLLWLVAQESSGEAALLRYLDGGRTLVDRTLLALESQFGFLRRMDFHADMSRKLADYGGTFLQQHLSHVLLDAAAWLPALLLAPFLAFFFLRDGRSFLKLIGKSVPNAYFERTLYMIDRVDGTARAYFQGLLKLTLIDAACLALGLWALGIPRAAALGLLAAVLAWVPYIGSVFACGIVVLVAATDLPLDPWIVYYAVGLFILVRLLDDFVFMPLTVGRSLRLHPLPTVLLIFAGGAVAGIPGLILVLPLAAALMVVAETIGSIVSNPRLRARNAHANALQARRVTADLRS
ncbi:MAG: AI-2E family transporter [Betaproteobacteria bacterium]|nr:AI-2E family transporter [Betaproteobacteria bacterium]